MYSFSCDYLEGAHPEVLRLLSETNMTQAEGYGCDLWCDRAAELIRQACAMPTPTERPRYGQPDVHFLSGGTQCNLVAIASLLKPYQGVISTGSAHIYVHEAGSIEATGHAILWQQGDPAGKLSAERVRQVCAQHYAAEAYDQTIQPGMVYISQPTEYGGLYSLSELTEMSAACRENGLYLYVDGARLAYALSAPGNDVTLADLARLTDAFYIGGTKCGALIGEALVLPNPALRKDFRYMLRRHGALLAKGRLLGQQFAALMEGGLYQQLGAKACAQAARIGQACAEAGLELLSPVVSNQVFVFATPEQAKELERQVIYTLWDQREDQLLLRFVTSWATTDAAVEQLCGAVQRLG